MNPSTNNKHNLKNGDRFRTKEFLGDIVVNNVFETNFTVTMEHVSGSDYYERYSFNDFNNKMITGQITSLIRY